MPTTASTNANLPAWFNTEGLAYLRAGDHEQAASWYEDESQSRPDEAHGWFGLGAANLALGRITPAGACIQNGLGIAPDFRLSPLLSAVKGLEPEAAVDLAEHLFAGRTTPTVQAALDVLDWSRAHPKGRRLGGRIKTLRDRCLSVAHVRSFTADDVGKAYKRARWRMPLLFLLFIVCAAASWFAYEEIDDAIDWGRPRHKKPAVKASAKPSKAPSARPGKKG